MNDRRIERLLSEAYGSAPDCPPAEMFLRASAEALSAAERASIDEHAARCPACAAERDLAREFDATPEQLDSMRDDVELIVAGISDPVAARRPPAARSAWLRPGWGLAAAAAVALLTLGGIALLRPAAPPLPPRVDETSVRGGRIETIGPEGELEALPRELRWKASSGAASYRVLLLAVDDTVLYEAGAAGPSLDLPSELLGTLHRAVVYSWRVEAVDAEGNRLAVSAPVSFRVKPGADGPPAE